MKNAIFKTIPETQIKLKPEPPLIVDDSGLATCAASGRSQLKEGDA